MNLSQQQFPNWREPSHEIPEHGMSRPEWEEKHAPWFHSSTDRKLGNEPGQDFHAGTFGAAMERDYGDRPYLHRGRNIAPMENTPNSRMPDPDLEGSEEIYSELPTSSHGLYYQNAIEDPGSTSIALPSREKFQTYGDMLEEEESFGKTVAPLNKSIGALPQPVTGDMLQEAEGMGLNVSGGQGRFGSISKSADQYPPTVDYDDYITQDELPGTSGTNPPLDPITGRGYREHPDWPDL